MKIIRVLVLMIAIFSYKIRGSSSKKDFWCLKKIKEVIIFTSFQSRFNLKK